MARSRSIETELRWRDLVSRHAESGLSVRAFCEQEGVSEPSLYHWKRELRKRNRGKGRIVRSKSPSTTTLDFVPVEVKGISAAMELVHPLGYQIRIDGTLDPAMLRQLLDVLEDRGEA